ncbi:MAG: DUF1902 domain-containing protein [Deltaproteobacteria bacterium]|jgi:hypothetical protein|nr:DUF1902 domain-containing protein [Deltaproteobacteria bacterium]
MRDLKSPNVIIVSWDDDSKVWMATSEDILGLFAQADTFEEIVDLLPGLVADLLSVEGWPGSGHDPVPLEILARHHILAFPTNQR